MAAGWSDRIAGVILLALAIAYWWLANNFQEAFGDPVGPSAFPKLIAIPMGLFALFMIVRPEPNPTWITPGALRQGLTLATLLLYPALIEPLGFPLSTFLGSLAFSRLMGGTWLQAVLTALGLGIGLFLVFDSLLGLHLPLLPAVAP